MFSMIITDVGISSKGGVELMLKIKENRLISEPSLLPYLTGAP